MKNRELYIVLTLKGRHLHTLRWLWHANRTRIPYHIVIADGEVHPTIDRLLSNPATFPNLSYEYHRYKDRNVKDYYFKRYDALGKVNTPYVMMADNDDFLLPFGINKAIAFLNESPDYVCAGGGIPGFSIDAKSSEIPNVVGSVRSYSYRYISNEWYRCRDFDDASVSTRVINEIRNPMAVHYNIYRTKALRVIGADVLDINPNLIICEMYSSMRTMTLGKVKSDPTYFTYLRQQGSSQYLGYSKDLIDDLLRSSLAEKFNLIASKIASEVAHLDRVDRIKIEDQIHDEFANQLRLTLANTMLRYRFPRLFALKQCLWRGRNLKLIPNAFQRRLDLATIWSQLADDRACGNTIAAHAAELSDICSTLQGDSFIEFISLNATDLLPSG
jgi:glycosyltransferase domain-containing protein